MSDQGSLTASDIDSLKQSDMAILRIDSIRQAAIWINKTKAEIVYITLMVDSTTDPPKNAFPFARLASVTAPDNQSTYLYHQMNETTFAEESFEMSVGEWGNPTYINVAPTP